MRNRFLGAVAFACFLAIGISGLLAQTAPTGDEDPTAKTGALKSQIETGGSYDSHSGNMTRIIPDLRTPNALGVYGLDFVRYYNSLRYDRIKNLYLDPAPEPNQPTDFGAPGWSHSWRWSADYEEYLQEVGGDGGDEIYHMLITITFPDGRASKYKIIRTKNWPYGQPWPPDPRFGPPYLASHGETNWIGGFHDHLGDMAEDGSNFWLYRADGGSVHFTGGPYGYLATEVYDPNGLKTTLHYNANWQLEQVEQEGGRHLKIFSTGGRIDRVESGGSAGSHAVEYGYSGGLLTTVTYPDDPSPGQVATAEYTYLTFDPPPGFFNAGPLLATANDPRFEGAMTSIAYTYQETGCRPQGQPWPPSYPGGQFDYYYSSPTAIKEEKNLQTGEVVSHFAIGCFDGTRMEYNGLGGFRKFFFGRSAQGPGTYSIQGYQLAKLTDFTNIYPLPANLPFEWQNYYQGHPRQIWDGRRILTETVYGDGSGLPAEIRHAGSDGSVYRYDRVNPGSSLARDPERIRNAGYHWLFSKTDERNQTTTYTRDERRRVTRIDYPGGSSEHFTYNAFNQVETHTLPSHTPQSPAIEYYHYDPQHRLEWEYNTVDRWDARKEYTYDELDRVKTKKDGRARINGKEFSVKMTYNGRHNVIFEEYPATNGGANPFKTYGYDIYGNCTAITNELGHRSEFTYDSYRRCTSYTEPLNAPDANGVPNVPSRRWDWIYDRYIDGIGGRPASAHTSKSWRIQVEPAFNYLGERRMTNRWHDLNDQVVLEQTGWIQRPFPAALGDWYYGPDVETRTFTYDENGNKSSYTDARERLTTYEYDLRNRLWKTIEPLNRITETLYDTTGNKTLVRFPDQRTQRWLNYDAFGQAWTFIDERNNTTNLTYQWGPMKKLDTVTTHRAKDGGGTEDQLTNFEYDGMGRPQWTIFPDGSSELTTYLYGQVDAFKTRKDQTKRIFYDARGREDYHTWDGEAAPGIDRTWDNANRLTSIANSVATINYGYDDAAQVRWESEYVAGADTAVQTNYLRYPDGAIWNLQYPNGMLVARSYTARGQLEYVWEKRTGSWREAIHYVYLADGKMWYQDHRNGVRASFDYDARGFTRVVHNYRLSSSENLSYRAYYRDERDRIVAWQKSTDNAVNPMENGRGDHYRYDEEGQLASAWYEAVDPANTYGSCQRQDHFGYDELGNRRDWNYVQSRGWQYFTRKDNGLNQYRAWSPYSIINYDDDIGGTWGAPGAANGVLMQDGNITAGFNALNQPMYIWSGASGWMHFGHDPLGRCVKRWNDSGAATYLFYDGWNLIQEGPQASNPSRLYVHGGRVDELVAQITPGNNAISYFHYDASGNCILQTDDSGAVMEQYYYDAFGYPYFHDAAGNNLGYSPSGNRFLFTGREWLSDLKLYDYRHRLYQPELGRFLQPDPKHFAAGDYNLYRYCHNDPINKSDPMGFDWRIDPRMSEKYKERTLDQINRARKIDPRIDQKFKDMEKNHNVMNTFTDAQTPENKRGARLADGTKGNSTGPSSKNSKDATIYYSPDNWRTLSGFRDPVIGLTHELPHAQRVNDGTFSTNAFFGGTEQEIEAIRFENIARAYIDGSHRIENPFRND